MNAIVEGVSRDALRAQKNFTHRLRDACQQSGAASSEACKLTSLNMPIRAKNSQREAAQESWAACYHARSAEYQELLEALHHKKQALLQFLDDEPLAILSRRYLSSPQVSFRGIIKTRVSCMKEASLAYWRALDAEERRLQKDLNTLRAARREYAQMAREAHALYLAEQGLGKITEKDSLPIASLAIALLQRRKQLLGVRPHITSKELRDAAEYFTRTSCYYIEHLEQAKKTYRHIRSLAAMSVSCMSAIACMETLGVAAGIFASVALGFFAASGFALVEKLYRHTKGKDGNALLREALQEWKKDLRDASLGTLTSLLTLGLARALRFGGAALTFGIRHLEIATPLFVKVFESALQSSLMKSLKKFECVFPLYERYAKEARLLGLPSRYTDFAIFCERHGVILNKEFKDLIFDFGIGAAGGFITLPREFAGPLLGNLQQPLRALGAGAQALVQVLGEKLKRRHKRAERTIAPESQLFLEKHQDILGDLFQLVLQEGATSKL